MKNKILVLVVLISLIGLFSCRGNSAKKAVDVVRKYSGKVFKSSEKKALMLRHGDDVIRHIDFQRVSCSACGGDGQALSGTCDACSGDGYVYKIKSK